MPLGRPAKNAGKVLTDLQRDVVFATCLADGWVDFVSQFTCVV